jgi:hypothetical protein
VTITVKGVTGKVSQARVLTVLLRRVAHDMGLLLQGGLVVAEGHCCRSLSFKNQESGR